MRRLSLACVCMSGRCLAGHPEREKEKGAAIALDRLANTCGTRACFEGTAMVYYEKVIMIQKKGMKGYADNA